MYGRLATFYFCSILQNIIVDIFNTSLIWVTCNILLQIFFHFCLFYEFHLFFFFFFWGGGGGATPKLGGNSQGI